MRTVPGYGAGHDQGALATTGDGNVSENFGHNKKSARNIVMWFNQ